MDHDVVVNVDKILLAVAILSLINYLFLCGSLSFVGVVILGNLSYIKFFEVVFINKRPLLFLGILFIIVGFQSLSL